MFCTPRVLALAGLFAVASVVLAHPKDEAEANRKLDKKLNSILIQVTNEGAALYNNGDPSGCYRLFQGALLAVAPMLEHRPALKNSVAEKLAKAPAQPSCAHRAFYLRKVIDDVRKEITKVEKIELPPATENKSIEGNKKDDGKSVEAKKDDGNSK